jgi:hypothetical protein
MIKISNVHRCFDHIKYPKIHTHKPAKNDNNNNNNLISESTKESHNEFPSTKHQSSFTARPPLPLPPKNFRGGLSSIIIGPAANKIA